jgi:hypothetical protein
MARAQRVGAADLAADGVVQHIVPERDDDSPADLATAVATTCAEVLASLTSRTETRR